MTIKRAMYASTLAAGVGLAGLFGAGLGTASADPGQCNMPGQPNCGQNQGPNNGPQNNGPQNNGPRNDGPQNNGPQNNGPRNDGPQNNGPGNPGPVNWQGRGVDQGRQDHQPFNWNGQQVTPMPAGNGAGWGFWFLGLWIPL